MNKKRWIVTILILGFTLILIISWPKTTEVNKIISGYVIDLSKTEAPFESNFNISGELSNYNVFGGDLAVNLTLDNLPTGLKSFPPVSHFKLKNEFNRISITKINSKDSTSFLANRNFKKVLIELDSADSNELQYFFVGPASTLEEAYRIALELTKNEPVYMNLLE